MIKKPLLILLFPFALLGQDEDLKGVRVIYVDKLIIQGNLVAESVIVSPAPGEDFDPPSDTGENPQPPQSNAYPFASFTVTPEIGDAPLSVSVDASASGDSDGTIESYLWDWGDGSGTSTGVTAQHTYATAGNWEIKLTIRDNDNASGMTTRAVSSTSPPAILSPPVASFTRTPATGTSPLIVSVDATGSSDSDGTIVSYDWDFDDGQTGSGSTESNTYTLSGEGATAYLYYRFDGLDDNSNGDARQAWRQVKGYESNDNTGTDVFNANFQSVTASSAPNEDQNMFDGSPSLYWDSFAAASGNHRWFYVRLDTGKAVRSVTLDPFADYWQPQTMRISGSNDGTNWTSLKDFSTSYNTAADTVVTDIQSATSSAFFTITLTVTDDDGLSSVATQDVEVAATAIAPVASFTVSPSTGDYPLLVSVDASASSDPDGSITSYVWNWGDGSSTSSGVTAQHTYQSHGTHNIILTVYDDDTPALSAQAQRPVIVTAPNLSPVANFTRTPATGTAPLLVNFDASASTDPDGTIASYSWDWVDGTAAGSGSTPSHTFTVPSLYPVRLTVTDNDGATASSTLVVEVSAAPQNPVASFTRSPTSGNIPLVVSTNASASSDPDGTIETYLWDWGDGTATSTGVTAQHTYTEPGDYLITLRVTDNDGRSSIASLQVTAYDSGLPAYGITITDFNYRSAALSWTDNMVWNRPWLIQRSTIPSFVTPTDLTNNQAANNTSSGTFRWLGVNATNYRDIDGLAEGTTYYYRVGVCTNLSEHYQNGATPTFTGWIYGEVTTGTLQASKKLTYNITNYGAVSNDGNNDKGAVDSALAAASAAGGGIIYFPAGVWEIWPTDSAVEVVDGYPEITLGESVAPALWTISANNITFLGEASGGVPTSFINLYLWGKQPATKWLNVLSGGTGSAVSNVKRYEFVRTNDIQDFTLKNLDIDMGAVPVNTGKEWYSLDEKRYQWDVSHKLIASFDLQRFKNVVVDTVFARNCRGEMLYNGGSSEKILIKNCDLRQSNSSTISGSFDLELVNTTIADSANAAVESNLKNDSVSPFTSTVYKQNHIARGCTFIGLDQSSEGVMKSLPGLKNFSGWLCFNEENTYQSVTDCTFRDFIYTAFGPWYEYRNGLRFNCEFTMTPLSNPCQLIMTWTSAQSAYGLDGGMSEILWLGDTINVAKNWPNHQPFFYSQVGSAAAGNESPWTWEAINFRKTGAGATYKINRLWVDTWSHASGRQNAVWKDWTKDSTVTFDSEMFQFLNANHIDPDFINTWWEQ